MNSLGDSINLRLRTANQTVFDLSIHVCWGFAVVARRIGMYVLMG